VWVNGRELVRTPPRSSEERLGISIALADLLPGLPDMAIAGARELLAVALDGATAGTRAQALERWRHVVDRDREPQTRGSPKSRRLSGPQKQLVRDLGEAGDAGRIVETWRSTSATALRSAGLIEHVAPVPRERLTAAGKAAYQALEARRSAPS
jgi:hypothetical protein